MLPDHLRHFNQRTPEDNDPHILPLLDLQFCEEHGIDARTRVLLAIARWQGVPWSPTYNDVAAVLRRTDATVSVHIMMLVRAGLVTRTKLSIYLSPSGVARLGEIARLHEEKKA